MKFNVWRFIKERMYEFYISLKKDGFVFAITIADIDFEISLMNCRKHLKE